MSYKPDISDLREQFGDKNTLSLQDIDAFYRINEPAIPKATVSRRIFALVQQGILQRVGHGKYSFGKATYFMPEVNAQMKRIGQIINERFPFIKYCQWELSPVNAFAQHLINFNVLFIDVERDAMESVYYELKDTESKVMLVQNLYDNISEFADNVIVRPLVTESPIAKIEDVYVASLEKILVDLYSDKEFISFQGNEIYHIFERAFEAYTINEQTMLRYAGRKTKREEIETILKTINRQ